MLFFCDRISDFNTTFSTLLGIKVDEGNEEEGNGQSSDNAEVGVNTFSDKWSWVFNVKQVSDMVHSPWNVVFQMNIVEFLNILSFVKDYNREVERINKERMSKIK